MPLLPRALYSLTQQTVPVEVLVVNDAAFAIDVPAGVRLVETGGHKGTAYARNLGLDHVETPYVFFLDADDYLLDTAIEHLSIALDAYDTCYVYSDWYRFSSDFQFHKIPAKNYNREYLLRHSVHLVSILIPTDIAKLVYYDINYRGWEDWAFHIELGLRGFCGNRVPEPLLIYDMTTSINREAHNQIADEVYSEIRDKYKDYIEGVKEFMACTGCGGKKPRLNLGVAVPPEVMDGMVLLEYMGEQTGAINFRVGRNVYRGANDQANKFAQVHPQDVQALLDKGPWRRVPKTVRPAAVPTPQVFEEWRQVNQVPRPANWQDVFRKDAVILEPAPEEPPKKRRMGRPKGTKNKVNQAQISKEPTVETDVETTDAGLLSV